MTLYRDRLKDDRIRRVRAGDLLPDERNWRKHSAQQQRALRTSMERIGNIDVLRVRETPGGLMLVDGHLRAGIQADDVVPVIVLDLDDAEAGEALATFDPIAAMAEADVDALRALVDDADTDVAELVADMDSAGAFGDDLNVSGRKGLGGYGNEEWYTPVEVIEAAREAMGGIDFDPASNPMANEAVKAAEYRTKDQDGLQGDWHGRVWMNPPWTAKVVQQFCDKLIEQYRAGNVEQACVLFSAFTLADRWQDTVSASSVIWFAGKKLAYYGPNGETGGGFTMNGDTVAGVGVDLDRFKAAFAPLGGIFLAPV